MLSYIYDVLGLFRSIFSRKAPWVLFVMVILGMIGCFEFEGVTSLCRYWGLQQEGYRSLLRFFRSQAWNLNALTALWLAWGLQNAQPLRIDGKLVWLGDHTYQPKDGRHMPGVVTHHQDSETQTKPSYFRGHRWAALGLLCGTLVESFCWPAVFRIHQGFVHLGDEQEEESDKLTLGQRMVSMALEWSLKLSQPSILVLDAFFSVSSVFRTAGKLMLNDEPWLTLLVRAKKNYIAFRPAPPPEPGKRGRPPVYGEKLKLYHEFEKEETFSQANACIYGVTEEISYRVENLLWRPLGQMLRFIWVDSSCGRMVLICNDLNMDPLQAIELYCLRVRIETMFAMMKKVFGAFCYHFWTHHLPRHSRKPKKNESLQAPAESGKEYVARTWDCYERFVSLAAIAVGLMQVLSIRFSKQIWQRFSGYLRTCSRDLPSERVVKWVVARQIQMDMLNVACSATMKEIRKAYIPDQEDLDDPG